MIDNIDRYFSKIITDREPETEEEFIYTLEFFGRFLLNQATEEYRRYPIGIISYDAKIDWGKVEKNFDHGILEIVNSLVELACKKFHLNRQGDLNDSFKVWFDNMAEKYNRKARYNESVFNNKHTESMFGKDTLENKND